MEFIPANGDVNSIFSTLICRGIIWQIVLMLFKQRGASSAPGPLAPGMAVTTAPRSPGDGRWGSRSEGGTSQPVSRQPLGKAVGGKWSDCKSVSPGVRQTWFQSHVIWLLAVYPWTSYRASLRPNILCKMKTMLLAPWYPYKDEARRLV